MNHEPCNFVKQIIDQYRYQFMNKIKLSLICLALSIVSLNAQTKAVITQVIVEPKKNGAFVHLFATKTVDEKHITGWQTDNGWFYITIMDAIADSARVMETLPVYPISEIQVSNVGESTQIALKLETNVENFEFYQAQTPPEILLSLRFPLEQVVGIIEEETANSTPIEQATIQTAEVIPDDIRYKRIRAALYLAGGSLTVAGIAIEASDSDNVSWEISTGLGIVVGTYLYDRFIYKKKQAQLSDK